ncbi:MAG TPA: Nif3-like dinuclear metal center hexameric protein [Desulfonatronum sp.]|nr:Nif3-like dinuclear metal center hexameric protein [Desulfonatronum sp.]
MRVEDVIAVIEGIAPPDFAASWDHGGVQVAARRGQVEKLAVTLDPVLKCVDQAMAWGTDFLLTHHPLSLRPGLPDHVDEYHQVLGALLRRNVWHYAAHTSLDVQPGGPVRWLAEHLGLKNLAVLESTGALRPRWFRILGQASALASLLDELEQHSGVEIFNAGPQALELVCSAKAEPIVRGAVKLDRGGSLYVLSQELDHPVENVGFGFVGMLPEPMRWDALAASLNRILGRSVFSLAGPVPETVHKVACCPGSGGSMVHRAKQAGADVFITGDLKYHDARNAEEQGLMVVDVGHFILEEQMMRLFAEQLRIKLSGQGVQVEFFPGRDAIALFCEQQGRGMT